MRKIGLIVVAILFFVAIFVKTDKEEEIRVRIIPNSDESCDLREKEQVKEMVVCYLKEGYSTDYSEFKNNILASTKELERLIEKEWITDCTVSFGKHTLYNKTYNDSAVENTEAMVLYVVLGEGKGSNWWGTVYPDFLQISSSEEVKYESLFVSIFQKIKGE